MAARLLVVAIATVLALVVALDVEPAHAQTGTAPFLNAQPDGTWVIDGNDGYKPGSFPDPVRESLEGRINRAATIVEPVKPTSQGVWQGGPASNVAAPGTADAYQAEGRALRARANTLPGPKGAQVRAGLYKVAQQTGALKAFRALGAVGMVATAGQIGWLIGTEAREAALGAKHGDVAQAGPDWVKLTPVSAGDVVSSQGDANGKEVNIVAPTDGFIATRSDGSTTARTVKENQCNTAAADQAMPAGTVLSDGGAVQSCGSNGPLGATWTRVLHVGFVQADPTVYPYPASVPAPGGFTVEGPATTHTTPPADVQRTAITTTTTQTAPDEDIRIAYTWVASQPEGGLDTAARPKDPTAEPAPEPTPTATPAPTPAPNADPGEAPDGAAACGLTPPSQSLDLSPIAGANLGSKVPFSLVAFVGSGTAGLGGSDSRPNASFSLLGSSADLGWLSNLDPLVGRVRLILTFLLWLGVAWFLYGRTIGRG